MRVLQKSGNYRREMRSSIEDSKMKRCKLCQKLTPNGYRTYHLMVHHKMDRKEAFEHLGDFEVITD